MRLLTEINQQIASKELQKTGKEYDDIERIWKESGSTQVPEKMYQLLLKILGDKQKVIDSFKYIGLQLQKHKEAADVLDQNVAQKIETTVSKLTPEHLRQLINVVRAGKL